MSYIEIMVKAAEAGGEVLKKYFGQSLERIEKSMASDFQTKADLESEKNILGILRAEFPNYNIFSEEHGKIKNGSEYTFVIDPLDGTNNFVLGIPNFSISIALQKSSECIAAVVYAPLIGQIYSAEKGKGAFSNGVAINVSSENKIARATVAHVASYSIFRKNLVVLMEKIYIEKNIKRLLTNWSVAFDLCLLAAGRIESIINNDSEIYDFAAGKLIAKEAGAIVTDFQGNPEGSDENRIFVASCNPEIHKEVLDVLKQ